MQIRLTPLLLLLCLSLSGPTRAEGEAAAPADTDPAAELMPEEALDPYVITPEQKARLDAQRERGQPASPPVSPSSAPADAPATEQGSEAEATDAQAQSPADPTAGMADADAEPELHPLIQSFVNSRYGREHCSAPSHCDNLVELQCMKTGDGPIYYYNNDNGRLLMTCGRACLNPDPYDERDCKKCPYTPWVECQERAWREEQERLRQAREAELAQLQKQDAERRARAAGILQQIEEIEQECDARIRELQRELDTLE